MIKEAAAGFVLVFRPLPFLGAWAQNNSMATELTVKERAFCRLIIEGTKTAAYRKVYSDRGSPATTAVAAYKLSKKPKVKAEVARLLRQREFPADDYAKLRDVAVAGLTEIFLQEADPRLRAKVGSVLLAYADAGLKLRPVPTEKEKKYDELMQLLDELAPERPGVISLEPEPPVAEKEPTEAILVEVKCDNEAPKQDAVNISDRTAADDTIGLDVPTVAASEAPEPVEEYEPIPGYFPQKFRRRVRSLG
jgi:hypothetical protein